MKSLSKELENREVPLCVVCKENPAREWCDTCSTECRKLKWLRSEKGKAYMKAYHQTERSKTFQRIHQKALLKLKNLHKDEFNKIEENLK